MPFLLAILSLFAQPEHPACRDIQDACEVEMRAVEDGVQDTHTYNEWAAWWHGHWWINRDECYARNVRCQWRQLLDCLRGPGAEYVQEGRCRPISSGYMPALECELRTRPAVASWCDWDVHGDATVDLRDVAAWLNHWTSKWFHVSRPRGDLED